MWIFRRAGLCQAGAAGITNTMFWNEIRNHIRERLPTIVDFILFSMERQEGGQRITEDARSLQVRRCGGKTLLAKPTAPK
jgi:hypothetical protein